jgi:hypothetical protein
VLCCRFSVAVSLLFFFSADASLLLLLCSFTHCAFFRTIQDLSLKKISRKTYDIPFSFLPNLSMSTIVKEG